MLPFRWLTLCTLLALTQACIPPTEEEYSGVTVDLDDPVSRRIYNHQNDRNADSLRYYLTSKDPSYRYLAARGLSSFPKITTEDIAALSPLLRDRDELIRTAAAWAIGQSDLPAAADTLTAAFDGTGQYRTFNATILAGAGKVGNQQTQNFLAGITTYTARDTQLLAGLVHGLFNAAGRNLQSPAGDDRIVKTVLDRAAPPAARQSAAWYLMRYKVEVAETEEEALRQLLRTESDPEILQGVARVIGRQQTPAGRVALTRALRSQTDWRVRVEVLRALAEYEYGSVRESVVESLKDNHPLVRRAAANWLRDNGQDAEATFYRQLAQESTQPDIKYVLYAAAQRHLPLYFTDYRGFLNYDLQQAFTKATNTPEKVDIINALGEYPWNYRNIYELYQAAGEAPVRTAAATALANISQREDFDTFFRNSARRVRYDLSTYFREMIESKAIGPGFQASSSLTAQADVYRPYYPDMSWFDAALQSYQLPRQAETYNELANARAALLGQPAPTPKDGKAPAKPINWDLLASDSGSEVVVRVPQGRVVMKLWPDVAPATVSNFLELIKEGYYDGKVFHRVIPNFLAQGGGSVGDGFGVADFTVRTETPGAYFDRAGRCGIASSGRDTESVQFYFMHRASPHLNGKYTVFAEVVEGQEVADAITVGTVIERIELR